jgi:hypothetical protein
MHGNALDLDVRNLSTEDRIRLINTASAMGFTGIGVYGNSIHLDIGARRAWGASHHSDSVPGWARHAIDHHLAGNSTPLSVMGSNGFKVDPRFADMSYTARDQVTAQTQKDIHDQAQQARVEQQALYKQHDDSVTLGIETGKIISESQILSDPTLDDGDIAKQLKALRAKQKEDGGVNDKIQAILSGGPGASVNSFDSDEKSLGNKAYDAMMKATPPEQQPAVTEGYIKATGYIPDTLQAKVRQGVASKDTATLAAALSSADALETLAPISFSAMAGGEDTRNKLATFRHYVNDLGMAGADAAQRIVQMDDPRVRANKEVLKPQVDKFVKGLAVGDVTSIYDAHPWVPGVGQPGAGINPVDANNMLSEYRELAEEQFYETGGDAGAAKARALADMKTRWNVSNISGKPNLMRMPPELHYPQVGGNWDYLRTDAMQTATDYAKKLGRDVQNIAIVPNAYTRADIEMNRPPRYDLWYQYTKDGQVHFDQVFGPPWGIETGDLKTRISTDQKKAATEGLAHREIASQANQVEKAARDKAKAIITDPAPKEDFIRAREAEAAFQQGEFQANQVRDQAKPPVPETPEEQAAHARRTRTYDGSQPSGFGSDGERF